MDRVRVLIVEDDADDAALVKRAAANAGNYEIHHVESLPALESIPDLGSFSIVLSDFALKGATAYDVIAHVKQKKFDIPIIVVSGTMGEEAAVDMVRAGACDYVMKDRLQRLPVAMQRCLAEVVVLRKQREAERALAAIVQSAMDGIVTADRERRIIVFNPAAEQMFGYRAAEVLGAKVEMLLPDAQKFGHVEAIERFARSGISSRPMSVGLVSGRKKDGTDFPLEISISRTEPEAGLLLTAICRDMTRQMQIQARNDLLEKQIIQSQKLESLGILAGGVAHEINNPLSVALQYAELLAEPDLGRDKVVAYGGNIQGALRRIARIVRDILTFARKDTSDFEQAVLREIVDVSVNLLAARLRKSRARLEINIPEDLPVLHCVPQRLEQALINLIGNALDALSGDPGGRVVVTAVRDGDQLSIVVEDNGPGIPSDSVHRVFDPFFTTKRVGEGTGLGLAVTYGIVQQHGGTIRVESGPGCTRFIMILPLVPPHLSTSPD